MRGSPPVAPDIEAFDESVITSVPESEDGTGVLAAVDLGSNSFHLIVARMVDGQLLVIDRLREERPITPGPGGLRPRSASSGRAALRPPAGAATGLRLYGGGGRVLIAEAAQNDGLRRHGCIAFFGHDAMIAPIGFELPRLGVVVQIWLQSLVHYALA